MMTKRKSSFCSGTKGKISSLGKGLVIAIDLGLSKSRKTCGLAWSKDGQVERKQNLKFGEAIEKVCKLMCEQDSDVVLIVEAPLSGAFRESGNPIERGDFEKANGANRYWYYGAGGTVCLGAIFFLRKLVRKLFKKSGKVFLYEGFVTGEQKPKDHSDVAELLVNCFLGENLPFVVKEPEGESIITVLDVIENIDSGQSAPAVICLQEKPMTNA